MNGSYTLSKEEIDKVITKKSAGNYALGYSGKDSWIVKYVGRSDTDLNDRVKDWVGDYKEFKFSYASSAQEAYEKELQNYNNFGRSDKLDNDIAPAKP